MRWIVLMVFMVKVVMGLDGDLSWDGTLLESKVEEVGVDTVSSTALVFRPAVVFLAYDRSESLEKTLNSFEGVEGFKTWKAFVSVDGGGDVKAIKSVVERRGWIEDVWICKRPERKVSSPKPTSRYKIKSSDVSAIGVSV